MLLTLNNEEKYVGQFYVFYMLITLIILYFRLIEQSNFIWIQNKIAPCFYSLQHKRHLVNLALKSISIMKLAEALLLRNDLQTKLASLQQRINNNVLVQEGDQPSEEPNVLLSNAFAINIELHDLIKRIHSTNAQAKSINGSSLLEVLNARDRLISQHRIVQQAIDNSRRENARYSSSEIRWVKVISVSELQKQADEISAKLRQNNLEIQASNWQIDLI